MEVAITILHNFQDFLWAINSLYLDIILFESHICFVSSLKF